MVKFFDFLRVSAPFRGENGFPMTRDVGDDPIPAIPAALCLIPPPTNRVHTPNRSTPKNIDLHDSTPGLTFAKSGFATLSLH
jgi:hypothetical protein